ncbi:MAG: nitroreductase family protein [Methanobacteriota archaeon]|nr:MAG: nitroreductase family protein [Euryarchaeota archaeon]
MELKEAIQDRRSIRRFGEKEVSKEFILELIELGNMAPSAGNLQARDFVVVEDPDTRRELARAALDQEFIAEAPISIVVCVNFERVAHYGARGVTLYCLQDAAAAIQNMLLAIHAEGFGCVWVGAFNEEEVTRILDLPNFIRPVAILPIGEPLSQPEARKRIPVDELVHYERW